jgi:hypothetical protein
LKRPYLKKKNFFFHKKRAGEVVQGVGLEFKPHTAKRKKKKIRKCK